MANATTLKKLRVFSQRLNRFSNMLLEQHASTPDVSFWRTWDVFKKSSCLKPPVVNVIFFSGYHLVNMSMVDFF